MLVNDTQYTKNIWHNRDRTSAVKQICILLT